VVTEAEKKNLLDAQMAILRATLMLQVMTPACIIDITLWLFVVEQPLPHVILGSGAALVVASLPRSLDQKQ
jgi:hypothetical protein